MSTASRRPDATRLRILEAAFTEFYRTGFQGGSLSHIVESAGVTKGALFHHFAGKRELGYAVVDDMIDPLLRRRWLEPIAGSADPLAAMQDTFRRFIREDIESGAWVNGCPLNNLAQEMSPLDEGFRARVDAMYEAWRATFAAALAGGAERGTVRSDIDPNEAAALIVMMQMGIWGTGKYSRDDALMANLRGRGLAWSPDLDALHAAPTRIVVGVGEESGTPDGGEMAGRSAHALAAALGQDPVVFPGGHTGFLGGEYGQTGQPDPFARTLREVLASAG